MGIVPLSPPPPPPLLLLSLVLLAAGHVDVASAAVRKPVIKELTVPPVADLRDPLTLWCRYDLGGGRLYSVKWYKDDQEFYRYMPDEEPPKQTFPVPFITLDEGRSGWENVTLTRLTFNTSGSYRCEVSVEAPSFDTTHQSANMSVMALPREDPVIEGVQEDYTENEWVRANCTSDKSSPAANLSWFINGAKAEQWLLDQMPPPDEEAIGDSLSISSMGVETWLQTRAPRWQAVDELGLKTSHLGLAFVAERRMFQGNPPKVELRCVAAIGETQRERVATARLAAAPDHQLHSASQRLNSAHLMTSSCSVLSAVLACWALRLLTS